MTLEPPAGTRRDDIIAVAEFFRHSTAKIGFLAGDRVAMFSNGCWAMAPRSGAWNCGSSPRPDVPMLELVEELLDWVQCNHSYCCVVRSPNAVDAETEWLL